MLFRWMWLRISKRLCNKLHVGDFGLISFSDVILYSSQTGQIIFQHKQILSSISRDEILKQLTTAWINQTWVSSNSYIYLLHLNLCPRFPPEFCGCEFSIKPLAFRQWKTVLPVLCCCIMFKSILFKKLYLFISGRTRVPSAPCRGQRATYRSRFCFHCVDSWDRTWVTRVMASAVTDWAISLALSSVFLMATVVTLTRNWTSC